MILFAIMNVIPAEAKRTFCSKGPVSVSVSIPDSKTEIKNSEAIPNRYGEVIATFQKKLTLETGQNAECVVLTAVAAEIKYDFLIRIDKRFRKGSCEWDAVLGHESDHVETYQSILFDFKDKLEKALTAAAKTVPHAPLSGDAVDDMAMQIELSPELQIVLREMEMEADLRNRHIDGFDYFDYMSNCK
jgi:hypothetical protein